MSRTLLLLTFKPQDHFSAFDGHYSVRCAFQHSSARSSKRNQLAQVKRNQGLLGFTHGLVVTFGKNQGGTCNETQGGKAAVSHLKYPRQQHAHYFLFVHCPYVVSLLLHPPFFTRVRCTWSSGVMCARSLLWRPVRFYLNLGVFARAVLPRRRASSRF